MDRIALVPRRTNRQVPDGHVITEHMPEPGDDVLLELSQHDHDAEIEEMIQIHDARVSAGCQRVQRVFELIEAPCACSICRHIRSQV